MTITTSIDQDVRKDDHVDRRVDVKTDVFTACRRVSGRAGRVT
jgi:hypothetical protein